MTENANIAPWLYVFDDYSQKLMDDLGFITDFISNVPDAQYDQTRFDKAVADLRGELEKQQEAQPFWKKFLRLVWLTVSRQQETRTSSRDIPSHSEIEEQNARIAANEVEFYKARFADQRRFSYMSFQDQLLYLTEMQPKDGININEETLEAYLNQQNSILFSATQELEKAFEECFDFEKFELNGPRFLELKKKIRLDLRTNLGETLLPSSLPNIWKNPFKPGP